MINPPTRHNLARTVVIVGVVLLAISDFPNIKLGAAGQVVGWVELKDGLKFAQGNVVTRGVVVADAGLKGFLEGWGLIS